MRGANTYGLINISQKAADQHIANHGDGEPGDDVPGMDGSVFGEDSVPESGVCETPATIDAVLPAGFPDFGLVILGVPSTGPVNSIFTFVVNEQPFGPLVVPPQFDEGAGISWTLPADFYLIGNPAMDPSFFPVVFSNSFGVRREPHRDRRRSTEPAFALMSD